jgi:hypothetical protein
MQRHISDAYFCLPASLPRFDPFCLWLSADLRVSCVWRVVFPAFGTSRMHSICFGGRPHLDSVSARIPFIFSCRPNLVITSLLSDVLFGRSPALPRLLALSLSLRSGPEASGADSPLQLQTVSGSQTRGNPGRVHKLERTCKHTYYQLEILLNPTTYPNLLLYSLPDVFRGLHYVLGEEGKVRFGAFGTEMSLKFAACGCLHSSSARFAICARVSFSVCGCGSALRSGACGPIKMSRNFPGYLLESDLR